MTILSNIIIWIACSSILFVMGDGKTSASVVKVGKDIAQYIANAAPFLYTNRQDISKTFEYAQQLIQAAPPIIQQIDQYDITINGAWTYLRELGSSGWTVKTTQEIKKDCDATSSDIKCLKKALKIKGCYAAWTGGFNRGKTTILNRVTDSNFMTGYGKKAETKGINFILPKSGGWIHIDTPGATRCVPKADLKDRFMTDKFVYDVLPDIADIVVLVVDILTSDEQILIDELMHKIISFSTKSRPKQLFIVHNYKTLVFKQDVEGYIQSDIIDAFKAKRKEKDGKIYYANEYKINRDEEFDILHFVFAANGREAGDQYNANSTELLKTFINGQHCKDTGFDIIQHFMNKLTPLLRDYFFSSDMAGFDPIDPGFDNSSFLVRTFKWFAGKLTASTPKKIKGMADPFKLKFKAVNDVNATYDAVIRLQKKRPLIYCNISNSGKVSEPPQCRPNVPCSVWQTHKEWAIQCKIGSATYGGFSTGSRIKPSDNIQHTFIVQKSLATNPCEIRVSGTIPPTWKTYVHSPETFELLHSDSLEYGWFAKTFKMPETICTFWTMDKKIAFENGTLTIYIPKVQAEDDENENEEQVEDDDDDDDDEDNDEDNDEEKGEL